MTASYEKKKAHRVQQFLNRCLEHNNYTSFGNTRVDATITLDDRTTFYMRSFPGKLKIKLDKTENSEESYYKMKDICEDIKNILAENKEEDR